eukprot:155543-Pelagomonas_calceolata.AAC.2
MRLLVAAAAPDEGSGGGGPWTRQRSQKACWVKGVSRFQKACEHKGGTDICSRVYGGCAVSCTHMLPMLSHKSHTAQWLLMASSTCLLQGFLD